MQNAGHIHCDGFWVWIKFSSKCVRLLQINVFSILWYLRANSCKPQTQNSYEMKSSESSTFGGRASCENQNKIKLFRMVAQSTEVMLHFKKKVILHKCGYLNKTFPIRGKREKKYICEEIGSRTGTVKFLIKLLWRMGKFYVCTRRETLFNFKTYRLLRTFCRLRLSIDVGSACNLFW